MVRRYDKRTRIAPDGLRMTKAEFRQAFGGYKEWDAAREITEKAEKDAAEKEEEDVERDIEVLKAELIQRREEGRTEDGSAWDCGRTVCEAIVPLLDTAESYANKLTLVRELQAIVRRSIGANKATLFLFGSSATGFAEESADLDIACDLKGDRQPLPEKEQTRLVHRLVHSMRGKFSGIFGVPKTRVPIVGNKKKGGYGEGIHNANFDLSFRLNGPLNSALLHMYAQQDPRLRVVIVAVKMWSKEEGTNNSRDGFLSSYAFVITLIYYLLLRRQLEWIDPELLTMGNISPLPKPHRSLPERHEGCWEWVGQALQGYFRFYAAEFDWEENVVTLNFDPAKEAWAKKEAGWDVEQLAPLPGEKRPHFCGICIADPYEFRAPGEWLNLGRHLTPEKAHKVKLSFIRTAVRMLEGAGPTSLGLVPSAGPAERGRGGSQQPRGRGGVANPHPPETGRGRG
eukprot:Hpha_TRINITY_DN34822_c0_g1::TRINITY_DN34822_c0_g1_i1::g.167826::m.167826